MPDFKHDPRNIPDFKHGARNMPDFKHGPLNMPDFEFHFSASKHTETDNRLIDNPLPNIFYNFNRFPNDKFWTRPNWRSLQTTISNLMKMVENSSKWVENTVGKGEIARCEQFLLFQQCFQKTCAADT